MMHPTTGHGFRFHAEYSMFSQRFLLWAAQGHALGYVGELTMVKAESDTQQDPTIKLTNSEAQGLFDALWEVGLRPQGTANVDGVVAAKNEHLADLRKVLVSFLGEEKL